MTIRTSPLATRQPVFAWGCKRHVIGRRDRIRSMRAAAFAAVTCVDAQYRGIACPRAGLRPGLYPQSSKDDTAPGAMTRIARQARPQRNSTQRVKGAAGPQECVIGAKCQTASRAPAVLKGVERRFNDVIGALFELTPELF